MTTARITAEELQALGHEQVPVAAILGIVVEEVAYGVVKLRAPYRDDFLRPGGTVSGPVLMAAADFGMWGAVLSMLGRVDLAVTTNLNMNFLRRPAPADVLAEARILKLGRRLAVGEVWLHSDAGGQLVAHATSTYSIPPERGRG